MDNYYIEMKIENFQEKSALEKYEKLWKIDFDKKDVTILVKIQQYYTYQVISTDIQDYLLWLKKIDSNALMVSIRILQESEMKLDADLLVMTEDSFIELLGLKWKAECYLVKAESWTGEIQEYTGKILSVNDISKHVELTHEEFEKFSMYLTREGMQLKQQELDRGTELNIAEYQKLSLSGGYLLVEEVKKIFQTSKQSNLLVSDTGTGKTYATVKAANEYAKEINGIVIVAYPTTSLTMQQGKQVFCGETIKNNEDRIVLQTQILNSTDRIFHCTYDYALKLIESLAGRYKINLIVDEVHNMSSALSYRRKVIAELIQVAKQVHKAIFLTATPTQVPLEYFDELYHSNVNKIKKSHRETILLGLDSEKKEQIADVIDLINYTLNYRNKKLLLFYNYKEDLRTIKNIVENHLKAKAVVITPNTKSSPQYVDLLEKGYLSPENKVDVILTTQFMAEGINLYLNQEFDVAAVISSESNLYSPEIIKQASHRIRDWYDRFYIMIEEKQTSGKKVNFQMLYHSEYTRAKNNLKYKKFYNQVKNSNLDGVDIQRGVTVENSERFNVHKINCFSIANNVMNDINEAYQNKTDLMIDLILLYLREENYKGNQPLAPFLIRILKKEGLLMKFPLYSTGTDKNSKGSSDKNRYKEIKENPEEHSNFERDLKVLLQNQESEMVKEKFISNYGEKLYDKMMDFATLEVLTAETILKIMDLDPAQQNLERFGKSIVLAIVQVAMDYQILKPDDMKLVKLLSYMEHNWKKYLSQTEFVHEYLNKDLPITQTKSDAIGKTEEEKLFKYYKGSYSWSKKSGKYLYEAKKFEHIAEMYSIDVEIIEKVAIKMIEKNYNLKHIQLQPAIQLEILNKLKHIHEQSTNLVESASIKSSDYKEVTESPEPMDDSEPVGNSEPSMDYSKPMDYPEPTPPPMSDSEPPMNYSEWMGNPEPPMDYSKPIDYQEPTPPPEPIDYLN